jgi:flagellar hook-basal body complex protein FliE
MVGSMDKQLKPGSQGAVGDAAQSFADVLKENIDEVNQLQLESREMTKKFMIGEVENIHDVTIAAERAGLAMKTLLALRKKMTEAFRDVSQIRL